MWGDLRKGEEGSPTLTDWQPPLSVAGSRACSPVHERETGNRATPPPDAYQRRSGVRDNPLKTSAMTPQSRHRALVLAMLRDPQLWVPLIALGVGLLVLQWVR